MLHTYQNIISSLKAQNQMNGYIACKKQKEHLLETCYLLEMIEKDW